MDNVTTQQIYNHWMNAVSSRWKLNAVEFMSAQQHIAGTPGWASLGLDVEDVMMAFTTSFFRDPIINIGNGR